jgi:hypothetical protein
MPDFNRHRPDDDLVETELAAVDGFWQCQFLDTGPKPADGGSHARMALCTTRMMEVERRL